ncbi:MAG: PIG-L family deacetylase [Pirellulaceae bacterium]|nr:PIG-L family deacetylase [Pirellulaceae bacterium]
MLDQRSGCRLLVLGAHPDDAEIHAGGLIARHAALGTTIRLVSVTDGRSGHHEIQPDDLVTIRREEARAAGQLIGADSVTWDFPDGGLQADLALRAAIIREIRSFAPDLVLTHRPWDYHPDHRAVAQAVQDACYLVTVPHIAADVPVLPRDPVVASMVDLFTRPQRFEPHVLLDISHELDTLVRMAACHASQVFQWLPYHDDLLESLPDGEAERLLWLKQWFMTINEKRKTHFQAELKARGLTNALAIEAYEISEYARPLDSAERERLFPGGK